MGLAGWRIVMAAMGRRHTHRRLNQLLRMDNHRLPRDLTDQVDIGVLGPAVPALSPKRECHHLPCCMSRHDLLTCLTGGRCCLRRGLFIIDPGARDLAIAAHCALTIKRSLCSNLPEALGYCRHASTAGHEVCNICCRCPCCCLTIIQSFVSTSFGCRQTGPQTLFLSATSVLLMQEGKLRQKTVNDIQVGRSVDETLRLVQAFQARLCLQGLASA